MIFKLTFVVAGFILLFTLIRLLPLMSNGGRYVCDDRTLLTAVVSPDSDWLAEVYSNACGAEHGIGDTGSFETIELRRSQSRQAPVPADGTIFVMDDEVNLRFKLKTKWLDKSHLLVTVPNSADVGTRRTSFGGVEITYQYFPDDPVERLCLLKWRSLPTDDLIRMSDSPGIKSFVAACETSLSTH